jgi:L-fuconolactonase
MVKIDAHQHFWKYHPVKHDWINDEMAVIRRDFLPADLEPLLKKNDIDGCVTVQAEQTEEENAFLSGLAEQCDFIKGVVGWIDLRSPGLHERLEYYSNFKKLKGFRHILQGEAQRDLMLTSEFKAGIGMLNKYGFTYDILIFPDQLKYAEQLVRSFPKQRFVMDHLAKPSIKAKSTGEWEQDIRAVAQHKNVYCKISGFVTEADWQNWEQKDFHPYFDIIVEAFGIDRLMFGSDWPVCLVAVRYEEVLNVAKDYFSSCSKNEQDKLFGLNAIQFYNL